MRQPRFTPQAYFWNSFLLEAETCGNILHQLEDLSYLTGNRTRDLPTCSTVSQPITLLFASITLLTSTRWRTTPVVKRQQISKLRFLQSLCPGTLSGSQWHSVLMASVIQPAKQTNSVAFSPQANYTD
jgi:hypothetical protein